MHTSTPPWRKRSPQVHPLQADPKAKFVHTSVDSVSSWPEAAQPLKKRTWLSYLYLLGDLFLVLSPIYFILMGVAVVTLNGKPTANNAFGSKVEAATQLGPTIFPIVFAAISGRSMKMVARYLAEKGARLSTLELLMASQSVWGTFESQLLMRRLTVVGANLLFLWALSPLGGQASLRLLEKTDSSNSTYAPVRYLSTGPGATAWAMATTYVELDGQLSQVKPLYSAALLGPDSAKQGPEDTWGNVKIPSLKSFSATAPDADGWSPVSSNQRAPEDYYSLVGIPVIGLSKDKVANLSLETTHLAVSCEPFTQVVYPFVDGQPGTNLSGTDFAKVEKLAPGRIWQNMSAENNPLSDSRTFFLQTDLPLYQSSEDGRFDSFAGFVNSSELRSPFPTRNITYVSMYANSTRYLNIANCSLSQEHTETMIGCTRENCAATRMRESRLDNRSNNVTGFDHWLVASLFLTAFPSAFEWSRGSTPTEQFIYNTSSFPVVSPNTDLLDNAGWADLSQVSSQDFSRRLSLLLNTFYLLTTAPNGYFGNLPSNYSLYGPDATPATDLDAYLPRNVSASNTTFPDWWDDFSNNATYSGIDFVGATANATFTKTHQVYACNYAWLSLLFAASGVTFAIGTASLVLKRKTLGPELFGFVASMTYENPFVRIPNGGSVLDAMERARLLRDVEVCIADVRGNEEVGHVALAAGVPLRKLERNRLYA